MGTITISDEAYLNNFGGIYSGKYLNLINLAELSAWDIVNTKNQIS